MSIGLILIVGYLMGEVVKKINLPTLVGILVTAPLGAFLMDFTYEKLLEYTGE